LVAIGLQGGGVVGGIEKLETTIGLEPMTCRLRSDGWARRGSTRTANCL